MWSRGGGIPVRERRVQSQKVAGKLQKSCGAVAKPPKAHGATLRHRGHTGHQQTREGDKQKAIAKNCEKLRKIAKTVEVAMGGCRGGWHGKVTSCASGGVTRGNSTASENAFEGLQEHAATAHRTEQQHTPEQSREKW